MQSPALVHETLSVSPTAVPAALLGSVSGAGVPAVPVAPEIEIGTITGAFPAPVPFMPTATHDVILVHDTD